MEHEEIVAYDVTKVLLYALIALEDGLPLKAETLISRAIMQLQSIHDFDEETNSEELILKFQYARELYLRDYEQRIN